MQEALRRSGSLEGLHDVVAPDPVSWLPRTPIWYALLAVVLALAAWATWRWYQRYRANRYRRAGLAELALLEQRLRDPDARPGALAALPVLVKRTALQIADREQVASLSGAAWLGFLDTTASGSDFRRGPGRLLPELAYARPAAVAARPERDVDALVAAVRRWITTHRAPPGVPSR